MEDVTYLNDELATVQSRNNLFDISLFKSTEYFASIETFVGFVKACEKMIRGSSEYKLYKAQLMEQGLTRCQFLGAIEADEDDAVTIEMHHGPILTLFDYVAIVIDWLLKKERPVNTFIVTRIVLNEHFEGNVQTVMLSKTVHQLVDSGEIFIHFNQGTGNLNRFLEKYRDGLNDERISKINQYIKLCELYENSFDNGLLDLRKNITDWDYEAAKNRMKKDDE